MSVFKKRAVTMTTNKNPRGVNFHDEILILEKAQLESIRSLALELPDPYKQVLMAVVVDIEEINQDDVTL